MTQDYTKFVEYIPAVFSTGESFDIPKYDRLKIDSLHPSYNDALSNFDLNRYRYPYLPLFLGIYNFDITNINVNCLRLLIHTPYSNKIHLPYEILFTKDFILNQIVYHNQHYSINKKCFIYLTIRTSDGDYYYKTAKIWHVDGFQGSRISRHIPEQDIIWSNINPTEFLMQPFFINEIDCSKYDIADYFDRNANGSVYSGVENGIYLITPYNIHRVTKKCNSEKRIFIRLTFSPIEIEDPTNTINPMIRTDFPPRRDVRDFLWSNTIDHSIFERNEGFVKIE